MQQVLLLHGALGSKDQFAGLEQALEPVLKTHAINFTGHGRVPSRHHAFTIQNFAHEVLDWMNSKQLMRADIFGYSMGGYVALWLARFYPGRVGKIFTLGTKLKWNREEADKEIRYLQPDMVAEKIPAFASALAQRHGEHEWRSVMHKTALMLHDLALHHLTDDDFERIATTVRMARGSRDTMVTADEVQHAVSLMPDAVYVEYENVEHPIEKVPLDLLVSEMVDFFS
ncbi:MAG: alpha/beta hydrolase [Chitinophagales bacterium]|nr:alpha/beta hydrolase [Chitinophagales bacterium]MDW8420081.1 alpha/beta hydrolase [Chitinophagales bacterium]